MNPSNELARHFAALHRKGEPLVLYNAWDAGSAKAIAGAGARAIGTSSWAVAAAHGYDDGEAIPLSLVEQVLGRIACSVALPVTVDIEGGYSADPQACAHNVSLLLDHGVAGINVEDRVIGGAGLYGIDAQCERIAAIRAMASARGADLFINARTDLFFDAQARPGALLDEARERAAAYARAGASGFFVPGLVDLALIGELAATIALPLNVMVMPGMADSRSLAEAGVARISHGPAPYLLAMEATRAAAQAVLGRQE
ncbi:isocitrate lyase/PEP mutase family protein [Pseudoduganella albidiflava]|uniref:Carboxyvinyl-carboxyphosphonate phosphorylmutase n=1 Tax=Pseudoduganella albidiflava TaxID=321983 RepID=A0A411WTC2_9BURK|nr:isocitrate lyase/phosphoenolpyruvate mutase family protein [Pseudoduganella albidiflava]QBH99891.1 isocitrate lyase/phosphoenolpyruvate mutase family protein [Pseudoduganella albidiflava]GGY54652.1 carboxyvinyl-carboxyphosphonate phosphorylmutase [Pseudoduganella albidiflava]